MVVTTISQTISLPESFSPSSFPLYLAHSLLSPSHSYPLTLIPPPPPFSSLCYYFFLTPFKSSPTSHSFSISLSTPSISLSYILSSTLHPLHPSLYIYLLHSPLNPSTLHPLHPLPLSLSYILPSTVSPPPTPPSISLLHSPLNPSPLPLSLSYILPSTLHLLHPLSIYLSLTLSPSTLHPLHPLPLYLSLTFSPQPFTPSTPSLYPSLLHSPLYPSTPQPPL